MARSPRAWCCSSNQGTAGAAEVFAAALDGNSRADLIGERTLGRAARQRLVKLPDGSGLLLTIAALSDARRASQSTRRASSPTSKSTSPRSSSAPSPPTTDAHALRPQKALTKRLLQPQQPKAA